MKKIFYIFIIGLIICNFKINVSANNPLDLCIVYEQEHYEKGDHIKLSFDLPKFSNLFSVIIRLEYNSEIVIPIEENNEYYKLNNHSIFNEFVVNKKINDNTLYAELMKNDVLDGYYSSYRNNLCVLEFNALSHIDDVKEIFDEEKIQIFLFDINHNLIDYNIKYVKSIEAGFKCDQYEVNVFSEELLLENIFIVNNRTPSEFLILEEKNIDYTSLGVQIYQIGVFDKITGKYQTYSTIINVVDKISPVIEGEKEVDILDTELDHIDFSNYIKVNDNYDKEVAIKLNYYNKEEQLIEIDYKTQILREMSLIVGFTAIDSSFNESTEYFIEFKLIDTTPPEVTVSDIKITDKELLEYDILSDILVEDNLDINPKLILSFYNSDDELIDDYKKFLTVNHNCYLEINAVDNNFNQSTKQKVTIILVDTISPVLSYNELTYINDVDINDCFLENLIDISDNDERSCKISYEIFYEDSVITKEELIAYLLENKTCNIKYFVYDNSLNYSECIINVKIKDTTPPVIKVNVEQDKIYKELNNIECNVTDNLSSNVNYEIYLNDNLYSGEKLNEGKYNLIVYAKDESGNEAKLECSFVISNKGMIGNIVDGNIKIKSSFIVVGVIMCSVIIGLIKLRCDYKIKNKFKES